MRLGVLRSRGAAAYCVPPVLAEPAASEWMSGRVRVRAAELPHLAVGLEASSVAGGRLLRGVPSIKQG